MKHKVKAKVKGKKFGSVFKVGCGVALAALFSLLNIGGPGGIPFSWPGSGGNNSQTMQVSEPLRDAEEEPLQGTQEIEDEPLRETEDESLQGAAQVLRVIVVLGDVIYMNEVAVSASEMILQVLEHNQPGDIWQLMGQRAILATIEEVRLLLRENNIEFTDVTDD